MVEYRVLRLRTDLWEEVPAEGANNAGTGKRKVSAWVEHSTITAAGRDEAAEAFKAANPDLKPTRAGDVTELAFLSRRHFKPGKWAMSAPQPEETFTWA